MQYDVSFGKLGKVNRAPPGTSFRLALLGDFTGRANAGKLEIGAGLASRKPHKVDVDDLDALMERLGLTISVPVDDEGGVISIPIRSMDDFHPDQLVENLPFLQELVQLRKNLQSKTGFDRAAKQVLSWSGETALPEPIREARGSRIATDRKLSDFARLTGRAAAAEAEPDDLIRRLVGPFIVSARDSRQDALIGQVDLALSAAMRRVLHHPDFQAAEALWRGLDMMVRRIETGARMQIVLYDISAEELAADLAASDQLDQSGLYGLLVEAPKLDANQGPLSLLCGLYEFEVTPPHADLLGRMAQIAAAAGAPFVAAVGPDFVKTPMHDWHPLIKQAWEALRALPASAYLGLVTPRFLLRMPYGKKTDPIDAFAFEEFTRQSGLSGMLWGNASLLVANLLAETWKRDAKAMKIGSVATVGDMPVYVFHDTDGEQIALPCTERLFTESLSARVISVGINPVLSLRGRPEVRVGGFAALGGKTLAGRWAPVEIAPAAALAPIQAATLAPPAPAVVEEEAPDQEAVADAAVAEDAAPEQDLDSLLASLGSAPEEPTIQEPTIQESTIQEPTAEEPAAEELASPEDDLDALLASLNAPPPPAAEDETEADLDALLASLK